MRFLAGDVYHNAYLDAFVLVLEDCKYERSCSSTPKDVRSFWGTVLSFGSDVFLRPYDYREISEWMVWPKDRTDWTLIARMRP